jgi:hypothetical protein
VLFTALLAAIAVKALTAASGDTDGSQQDNRMKGKRDA